MAKKRKLSSSYVRKREDIKTAVVSRAIQKIRIAAGGPGYRTPGTIKPGSTVISGPPTGTKRQGVRGGAEITVAKRKAINRNTTPKKSENVKARKKPIVATSARPYKPYAGKLRPISNEVIRRRKSRGL